MGGLGVLWPASKEEDKQKNPRAASHFRRGPLCLSTIDNPSIPCHSVAVGVDFFPLKLLNWVTHSFVRSFVDGWVDVLVREGATEPDN